MPTIRKIHNQLSRTHSLIFRIAPSVVILGCVLGLDPYAEEDDPGGFGIPFGGDTVFVDTGLTGEESGGDGCEGRQGVAE